MDEKKRLPMGMDLWNCDELYEHIEKWIYDASVDDPNKKMYHE